MAQKTSPWLIKFRNVTRNLQKISECPVCLEVLKCPFKTCKNRHSICQSCAEDLEVCPTCQSEIHPDVPVVPAFVEKLLESLPRMCKYSENGCKAVVEYDDSNHETFCGFRLWECTERLCGSKVPMVKLAKHYEEFHKERFIVKYSPCNLTWPQFDPKKRRSAITPVFLNKNWLWVSTYNDIENKCLEVTFKSTPIGQPQKDWFVKISFTNVNFVYQHTLKAAVEESNVHSTVKIENYTTKEVLKNVEIYGNEKYETGSRVVIPQFALKHFVYGNGGLEFKVEFFSLDRGLCD